MKNTQKQVKESGKVQLSLLLALALAAGGSGICSELHAAGATATKAAGYGITVNGIGVAIIDENGDGTAQTMLFAYPSDGSIVNGMDMANSDYSIAANAQPGKSGKGTGSGTASATIDGTIISPDFSTFTPTTLQLDVAVAGTTDVSASVNQGITVSFDPLTGQSSISRVNSSGTQYSGATAGSYTVSVGGSPITGETGVYGVVGIFS